MRRLNHFRAAGIMAVLFLMCTFPSYGSEMATPSNAGGFASVGHIHDLVTEETEATCLLNGRRIVTCRLCQDYREEITLPMLGHCECQGRGKKWHLPALMKTIRAVSFFWQTR